MIIEKQCPPGTKLTPVKYSFLKPARLRIRDVNGFERLIGYGVGEQVEVMEPSVVFLIMNYDVKETILLSDGSVIVEWPSDLSVQQVWS